MIFVPYHVYEIEQTLVVKTRVPLASIGPQAITARGSHVALIALGSPYLLRSFPNLSAYVATFSSVGLKTWVSLAVTLLLA